jgi:hypothetical protein
MARRDRHHRIVFTADIGGTADMDGLAASGVYVKNDPEPTLAELKSPQCNSLLLC